MGAAEGLAGAAHRSSAAPRPPHTPPPVVLLAVPYHQVLYRLNLAERLKAPWRRPGKRPDPVAAAAREAQRAELEGPTAPLGFTIKIMLLGMEGEGCGGMRAGWGAGVGGGRGRRQQRKRTHSWLLGVGAWGRRDVRVGWGFGGWGICGAGGSMLRCKQG